MDVDRIGRAVDITSLCNAMISIATLDQSVRGSLHALYIKANSKAIRELWPQVKFSGQLILGVYFPSKN
jgi:hypothetical protein